MNNDEKENQVYTVEYLREIERLQHNQQLEARLTVVVVLLFLIFMVVAYGVLQ